MEFNELFEVLIEAEYFTEGELGLLININGATVETLEAAIYARYGYRSWEQLSEA